MDCIVRGAPKSWTRLSNFHFHENLEVTFGEGGWYGNFEEGKLVYKPYIPLLNLDMESAS